MSVNASGQDVVGERSGWTVRGVQIGARFRRAADTQLHFTFHQHLHARTCVRLNHLKMRVCVATLDASAISVYLNLRLHASLGELPPTFSLTNDATSTCAKGYHIDPQAAAMCVD